MMPWILLSSPWPWAAVPSPPTATTCQKLAPLIGRNITAAKKLGSPVAVAANYVALLAVGE